MFLRLNHICANISQLGNFSARFIIIFWTENYDYDFKTWFNAFTKIYKLCIFLSLNNIDNGQQHLISNTRYIIC